MKIFAISFVIAMFSIVVLAQTEFRSRAPFAVEVPEVTSTRYTSPVIRLPSRQIASFRVRTLEPFASQIDYGKIIVTLNGTGINRGCEKKLDLEGKIVNCFRREDRLDGFQAAPGKNVLEVRATDRKGAEYYASYIVVLGDNAARVAPPEDSAPETFRGRKFAIVVGVSEYMFADAGLSNLSFADDDAEAVASFLKSPAGGGFAPADTTVLINRDASLTAFRAALSDVAKRAKPEDLVFIFLAGHGAPDPFAPQNLYFLLSDTKVADMPRTGFPMGDLKTILDTQVFAKRVIVLIDTCHSAGISQKSKSLITGRQLIREDEENNISNFYLSNQLFRQTGRAIITSSDVDEVSQESPQWGTTAFLLGPSWRASGAAPTSTATSSSRPARSSASPAPRSSARPISGRTRFPCQAPTAGSRSPSRPGQ